MNISKKIVIRELSTHKITQIKNRLSFSDNKEQGLGGLICRDKQKKIRIVKIYHTVDKMLSFNQYNFQLL